MELYRASQLGTTQDIERIIQLFMILIQVVSPIIICLLCIIIIRSIQKALERRQTKKKHQRKAAEQQRKAVKHQRKAVKHQQEIDEHFKDDDYLMKQLNGTHEPFDKSNYQSLDIAFDTQGRAIPK